MKRITRGLVYYEHSRFNKPTLWVEPGETFVSETELCSGDWLHAESDRWSPGIGKGPNPTVCVAVAGAAKGDMLAVTIEDIVVD